MPDLTITRTPYAVGETTELPAHLEANEQALETAVENLDSYQAVIENELHGIGTVLDPATDTVLQAGAGLSVQVLNQSVYVDGRRYTIAEGPGWLVVAVPSVQTSHVYLDKANVETVLNAATNPDPQAAKPAGTWYVGQCTTDATDVTAVDYSACDTVQGLAGTQALALELQADIGTPYDQAVLGTVKVRLAVLEGGGPGPAVYWGGLEKTAINPTTIPEELQAWAALVLAAAVDQAAAVLESENWDENVVLVLNLTLLLAHLAREFAIDHYRAFFIVPGIVGHLFTGDPNGLLDESVSSMDRVSFSLHRFG